MARQSKEVKKAPRGFLRPYKTYSFVTKDPVIDLLRTVKDDTKAKIAHISGDSGVSSGTLYNWFSGKTRRPQFATVVAVARAMMATERLVGHISTAGRKPLATRKGR